MRVLITAGTGTIGRALVRELGEKGHDVTVTSRDPSHARSFTHKVQLIPWDARAADPIIPTIEASDAVVHLVGESIGSGLWTASKKARILQSRVASGRALTEAVARARHKPQVVVQASAIGYYGSRDDVHLDEDAPPGTDWMARTAVQWEASTAKVTEEETRRIVIRTGLVLSAGAGVLPKMMLPFKLFVGGPLGSGTQGVSWIHLQDLASAIRFLIEHPDARGPFNLTAPAPVTNAAFGKALSAAMHRPYWLPAPAFAMRLVLGELSQLVLQGQFVIPRRLTALGFAFRFPDLPTTLADLL